MSERPVLAAYQLRYPHPPSPLSAAIGCVVACLASRRGELPEETTSEVVRELTPCATEATFARLSVLLVERCLDGREVLRRIALEEVTVGGAQ